MAVPHTEVAIVPMVKGATPMDPNSVAGKIVREAVKVTAEQPGYIRMIWGVTEERPDIMVMLVDWEDISFHKQFEAAPFYDPFMEDFNQIVDGPLILLHAQFDPVVGDQAPAFKMQSAVTEFVIGYFPLDRVAEQAQEKSIQFREQASRQLTNTRSCVIGWCMEETVVEERTGKGKEKAWIALIGWEGDEQRQATRNQDLLKMGWIPGAGGELNISRVQFLPGPGV